MNHNKRMNENELTILVNNEIEWRRKMWKKMEKMESNQIEESKVLVGLKVKVALFGCTFGAFGGALITLFKQI